MTLLKVTLLFLAVIGHQAAFTRPHIPRKDEQERASGGKGIGLVERLVNINTFSYRTGTALVLSAEAAVSYAMLDPSSPRSRTILSLLLPGGEQSLPNYMSPLFLAGVASTILGAIIRVLCFRELGRFFTFVLTIGDKHKLISSGPYSIVRHPSYTGMFLVTSGLTMCEAAGGSWWMEAGLMSTTFGKAVALYWAVLSGYVILIISRGYKEDEMLRKEFGETWEEYAKKVPCRYVPGIF